jgi:exosortase
MTAPTATVATSTRSGARTSALAASALAVLALAVSYAPNLRSLAGQWDTNPNYSYGYLVIPIALLILWQRRGEIKPDQLSPNVLGWVALLAVLVARAWLFERNEQWLESATIPLAAAALILALGGWSSLKWALPGLAFLWLMLPLPPRINMALAGPLQSLATWGSVALLQAGGLPAIADGNVILVGAERLNVEQACNGLSMLLAFVTLITATVILIRERPLWERIVLLLSTIPIALISNVLRIAITSWAYYQFGPHRVVVPQWSPVFSGATVERLVHDTAGWAMMPIALVLVALELRLLSWLVIEQEVQARPRLVLPTGYTPPRPVKPKPPMPQEGTRGADRNDPVG